jgi:hypothetical protein
MYVLRIKLLLALVWLSKSALCQHSTGSNALTDQLAGDSDSVANILGEGEAMDLVSAALRRVKEKRKKAELNSRLAEVRVLATTKNYQKALADVQDYITQSSQLKSKLAHLSVSQDHYSQIAKKTDKIAERMRQLAEQAEARLQEDKSQEDSVQSKLSTARAAAEGSNDRKEFIRLHSSRAEKVAKKAATKLAQLDMTISQLLGQRTWLKEVEAANDRTASTRFVE